MNLPPLPEGFEIQEAPAAPVAAPAAPATAQPELPPAPEGFEVQETIEAPAEEVKPSPISDDEFRGELAKRLNDPKMSLEDVLAWAPTVGRTIIEDDNWKANAEIAMKNRKDGTGGAYGQIENKSKGGPIGLDDIGAFYRGFAQMASGNSADEIVAGTKAALGFGEGDTVAERYRTNWERYNAQDNIDEIVSPEMQTAGKVTGIIPYAMLPMSGVKTSSTLGMNMLRSGGIGALEGAFAGTMAGSPDDRFGGTAEGAGYGAAFGAAAPAVVKGVGVVAKPVMDFFGTRFGGDKGVVNALGRRIDVDPERMAQEAEAYRMAGINVAPYDVLGEVGQDVVGALGRRMTPGRAQLQDFANEARVGLPDRVSNRAKALSSDPRTPDQIVSEIEAGRNTQIENAMAPIRNTPIPLEANDEIMQILQTGEGRLAVRQAAQLEKDPAVKQQMLELVAPAKETAEQKAIREQHAQVKAMGLSPDAEAAALAQLPPLVEAERVMTLDMADKIRRSFSDAAGRSFKAGDNGKGQVLKEFGQTIRNTARQRVPEYEDILKRYGEESTSADAVRTGEELLTRNTDEFVANVEGLSDAARVRPHQTKGSLQNIEVQNGNQGDKFVSTEYVTESGDTVRLGIRITPEGKAFTNVGNKNGGGILDEEAAKELANTAGPAVMRDMMRAVQNEFPEIKVMAGERVTGASKGTDAAFTEMSVPAVPREMSDRDLARAGGRRAIERKAGESVAGAYQTAEGLAMAPEQLKRTQALLGNDKEAADFAAGMRAEVDVTRNRVRNAPQSGSRTSINNMDNGEIPGLVNLMANPTSKANWISAGLRAFQRAGINDKAAQRVIEIVTDTSPEAMKTTMERLTKAFNGNKQLARKAVQIMREGAIRTTITDGSNPGLTEIE